MKTQSYISVSLLGLFLIASLAQAHPIAPSIDGQLIDGIEHPFWGLDHMLTITAIGIWAGQRASVMVPVAFVILLFGASILGVIGLPLPVTNSTLAGSVLVLGLIVGSQLRLPIVLVYGLVAWFALCHGYMHGLEIAQVASPQLYETGFILATTLLLGFGIIVGYCRYLNYYELIQRVAGASLLAGGTWLMMA